MTRPLFALLCGVSLYSVAAQGQVRVTQKNDQISIQIDRRPEIAFYYGPGVTKPYLYPLLAPSGEIVTRQWPMNPQPGERHDHIHHRGVWFAHSNVNGVDFWNSDPSYKNDHMGHIVVSRVDSLTSGKRSGSITAELDWMTPANQLLLHEKRVMTFYAGSPGAIDFDFTLTARVPVKFGDDKDGVFGMRLAAELEEASGDAPGATSRNGVMTSSNGCHQEAECWGKRADWIDVSGKVRDQLVGVSIFDHPANPRHPSYWHARAYGLLAANIFGAKAFTGDSHQDGSLSLETGGKLRFRYRVIVHPGDAKAAGLDEGYLRYTDGLR